MSKNITIQEGGIAKALTVDGLKLKMLGGSSEDWLPADGKDLVELEIGGSGTYQASTYGAYGIAVARVKPKYGGGATSKAVEHEFTQLHMPTIKEGGKGYTFAAALLETDQQGGGECLWVPRKDVELKTKHINQSGVYTARADDCYGFSEVTVSGVDVDISQDDDGDDVAEITDGGVTTETKLPSSIVVEVPPTKTVYAEGQAIDYTGMVVKAYTNSGQLWTDESHPDGVIPIAELTLTASTAHADAKSATSDLDTGDFTQPIPIDGSVVYARTNSSMPLRYNWTYTPIGDTALVVMRNTTEQTWILVASASNEGGMLNTYTFTNDRTGEQTIQYSETNPNNRFTYNGLTVFYTISLIARSSSGMKDFIITPEVENYGDRGKAAEAAWTAIYGNISEGAQEIPVQWNRPYDYELLETSFSITVG